MKLPRLVHPLRTTLAQNILSLFGLQVVNYMLPLVLVPYLARVLGVAGWGRVAFTQGFAAYLMLFVEYGFDFSGTREVARNRDDANKLNAIVGGTVGAKLMLSLAVVGVTVILGGVVPVFRQYPALLWAGLFYALARAHSMIWYFQGVERMKVVAVLDAIAKIGAALAVFVVVRSPADDWKVIALQGAGATIATLLSFGLALRATSIALPHWKDTRAALRNGWTMFVFRGSVSLYTAGNAFILGLFVTPKFVGYYSGGERIIRAAVGLMMPATRAIYPRIASMVEGMYGQALRLVRLSLLAMSGAGLVLGVGVAVFAPWIVGAVLGPGYEPSILVLRILSVLPFLIGVSNVLGVQWMLPLGMDRTFNKIIISAGLLNILLAVILAPMLGHVGMAVAVVTAETVVTVGMAAALKSRARMPLYGIAPVEESA